LVGGAATITARDNQFSALAPALDAHSMECCCMQPSMILMRNVTNATLITKNVYGGLFRRKNPWSVRKCPDCPRFRTPDTHGPLTAVPMIILVFGWRRCDNYSPRYSTLGARSSSRCSLALYLNGSFCLAVHNALWGPTKAMLFHNSHTVIARFGEKARFASESVRSVPFFLLGRS